MKRDMEKWKLYHCTMDEIWGSDPDNDEDDNQREANFLNVESKNQFVNEDLSIVLEDIEKKLHNFAKENNNKFQSYIIYNDDDDKSHTYTNDAYTLFEIYCTVVDKMFEEYVKKRGITKNTFINNLREVIDSESSDKYSVLAILSIDSFEKFAQFMMDSNAITENAKDDAMSMGF